MPSSVGALGVGWSVGLLVVARYRSGGQARKRAEEALFILRLGSQDKFYMLVLASHSTAENTAFQRLETIPPQCGCWLER